MASNITALIKKAAMDAVLASKPTAIVYGEVKTISPLTVFLDQKITVDEDFLVVPSSFSVQTVTGTTSTVSGHSHTVEVTIDNSLKVGDKVLMVRNQGGQQYIIFERGS